MTTTIGDPVTTVLGVPVVTDERIQPGVLYIAPIDTELSAQEWTRLGKMTPGTMTFGFDPTPDDPFDCAVIAWKSDATITLRVPRPPRRLINVLYGRWNPPSRRTQVPKLSIDGRAYHRRQRARRRRG